MHKKLKSRNGILLQRPSLEMEQDVDLLSSVVSGTTAADHL